LFLPPDSSFTSSMKLNYKFNNILGSVFAGGNNLVFTPNSHCLVTPVGNRVSILDLKNNKSRTLEAENGRNIDRIAVSPCGQLLITIDDTGRALLINLARGTILAYHSFKTRVLDIQFSPGTYLSFKSLDGKLFAVTIDKKVQVWKTPHFNREFAPFVLVHTYTGHFDDIVSISWSPCSGFFITTSKDMTSRIYSSKIAKGLYLVINILDYIPVVLAGHRDTVIGAWFGSANLKSVYSVSKDGALIEWVREDIDPSNLLVT
jgi:periodic tryptophan protein 2